MCEPHPYTCPVPAQAIKAARGVRDILPAERVVWWRVEAAAAAAARSFGYAEIETPVIEPVGLIERGVGGDTDVVRKEMFRLEPHGEEGTRLVLRPEATAGIVRAYFEGNLNQEAELVHGGVSDEQAVRRAVEGVEVVFHLAAHRAVLRSVEHPLTTDLALYQALVGSPGFNFSRRSTSSI